MAEKREEVTLMRDVEAVRVPAGDRAALTAGERATITQALGDAYSVVVGGNLYRIAGKDADALGKTRVAPAQEADGRGKTREAVQAAAWEQLHTCYDPEIPVNIVELGLVYACEAAPLDAPGAWRVEVRMTLTAPACGMGEHLVREIEQKLLAMPGVMQANVELVWECPKARSAAPCRIGSRGKREYGCCGTCLVARRTGVDGQ
ncbi:MAG: DUF59 domain-containing protein [Betaproteobacteria bacterium]|nr:DUF59 domain-containing protein [Betaproteobacteria bacterium]